MIFIPQMQKSQEIFAIEVIPERKQERFRDSQFRVEKKAEMEYNIHL